MKIILSLLITTFAIGALACPTLEGSYTCKDNQAPETYTEEISQYVNDDGFTVYEINGDTVVTDGVKRKEGVEDGGSITYSAKCNKQVLKMVSKMSLPAEGLTAKFTANAKPTKMGYKINGKVKVTFSGQSQTQKIKVNCKRN